MRNVRGMPAASSQENLTVFPPFEHHRRDSPLEFGLGRDSPSSDMTSPFIKNEPSDYTFDPNQYMQFNGQHSNNNMSNPNGNMNINPANLTNGNGNNGYMSSSFMGGSGIADDELLDLQIDQPPPQNSTFDFNSGMSNNFMNPHTMSQQSPGMFSNAGDNGSMASPFTSEFNYNQFRSGQQFGAHSMPQQQQAGFRPHIQHVDRKVSDSRSPATPNTPSMNHLNIDDYTHPNMQPIHRPHNSLGNGWESGGHSWDQSSPFPSPPNGQPVHPQISEVLRNSNTHHHKVASSLPTKMEPGTGPMVTPQDAKRKRRRESHNMVERRRRDNINERIHDLGTLVPQHRLEDEKVRKHLVTNAPLSPSIANAASMSPPNAAASLLGGSSSRRTGSGNITVGLPIEEKDKGPNKGDILNGSVAWTRDMMWFMHLKLQQEQEVKDLVSRMGGQWPFEVTEEENRMRSEIMEILKKHSTDGFSGFTGYSRAPGSGLRVPGYTNVQGDSTNDGQSSNGRSLPPVSPGFQPGGSGMSSGMSHNAPNQFWGSDLKEEDEYELMH